MPPGTSKSVPDRHEERLMKANREITSASLLNRREFLRLVAAGGAAMSLPRFALAAGAAPEATPPNVVIIFVDDLGYDDLGCFWTARPEPGYEKIETPHLDAMAAGGVRFTDFYVAASVCTPSRAALVTGCYPQRVGLAGPTLVLHPNSTIGISDDEVTIAELLKARGYATACIGKWHLGHLTPFLPTRHGFDRYYGIPYSNDMKPSVLMRDEAVIEQPVVQATLTERYTAEAIRFIKDNKDKPFFLYLPHTMPHTPLHISDKFKGKSRRGLYGDVVECLDWSVGRILDTLAELGLDKNTLVIFTSDNGPWLLRGKHGGKAHPLRAGKCTTYEGGMRVPCIMRWPGSIPAGSVCSEVATTMDLLPTVAGLAGAAVPQDRIIDGRNIRPLMTGAADAKSPHDAFYYYHKYTLQAVRSGKWKLMFRRTTSQEYPYRWPGMKKHGHKNEAIPDSLYDLEADIGETTNVIAEHPDVAQRLRDLADRMRADLGDSRTGHAGKNRRKPGSV